MITWKQQRCGFGDRFNKFPRQTDEHITIEARERRKDRKIQEIREERKSSRDKGREEG